MKISRIIALVVVVLASCKPDEQTEIPRTYDAPTAYNLELPNFFPEMEIPEDNPLTEEGVRLGRFLFYERRLSGDNTLSCAGCHRPNEGFSDSRRFSEGITGERGTRNSMPMFNLGYAQFFFWDGRAKTLEEQILEPVPNPIEMHQSWQRSAEKLANIEGYKVMFGEAFGTEDIDSIRVSKAIAQFLRTMVSGNSKFDRFRRGEVQLTAAEQRGLDLFQKEGGDPELVPGGQNGADCFHCHGFGDMQFTDGRIHNNGLDSEFWDLGAGGVNGNPNDYGKFKTPSLRNISFTAPYMHDGRFATIEEVIEHYNSGGKESATIDPFMKYTSGGLQLSDEAKADLIAFLETLNDEEFMNNPAFAPPREMP